MNKMGPLLGGMLLLVVGLAPSAAALPLVDPTLPAPYDLQADYDATSGYVTLSWQGPTNLPGQVSYIVYQNGDVVAIVTTTTASLPVPEGPAALQVSTLYGGSQSTMSSPILLFGGDVISFWGFVGWQEPCPPLILGLNPNFPYVFHVDWDCLPDP